MKCKCTYEMTNISMGLKFQKTMLISYCGKCGRMAMGDNFSGYRWFQSEKSMNNDLISKTDVLDAIEKSKPDALDTSLIAEVRRDVCENIKIRLERQKSS